MRFDPASESPGGTNAMLCSRPVKIPQREESALQLPWVCYAMFTLIYTPYKKSEFLSAIHLMQGKTAKKGSLNGRPPGVRGWFRKATKDAEQQEQAMSVLHGSRNVRRLLRHVAASSTLPYVHTVTYMNSSFLSHRLGRSGPAARITDSRASVEAPTTPVDI